MAVDPREEERATLQAEIRRMSTRVQALAQRAAVERSAGGHRQKVLISAQLVRVELAQLIERLDLLDA